jgi:hypothetical protein
MLNSVDFDTSIFHSFQQKRKKNAEFHPPPTPKAVPMVAVATCTALHSLVIIRSSVSVAHDFMVLSRSSKFCKMVELLLLFFNRIMPYRISTPSP